MIFFVLRVSPDRIPGSPSSRW
ncbi:MAG: hypothetical protein JWO38_5783, partial [Gemmataceae bacterium]|nr:hypothetical protein [Gemmataceae bacterium]MDB5311581.1 hypothetical protein [Gemmataceae bacterium]